MEERIVIRRIRITIKMRSYWRYFEDVNGYGHNPGLLKDFIGTKDAHRFKTHVTTKHDTKYKIKYSPNKSRDSYRENRMLETREYRKNEFLEILKDYGIK
jgi:hypothetical protein